ncbi:hypothetical protein D3M70_07700 [Pseudomonas sp. LS-2]|jgi:type VI protein secretion system component Hcp|nr:hypothetical protein D3M70_07700 [Pseudomonas sp. LS-2]
MAFDGFIKLDGIAGESLDQRHKDWIEIVAYKKSNRCTTPETSAAN